jgi:hypothetical protein
MATPQNPAVDHASNTHRVCERVEVDQHAEDLHHGEGDPAHDDAVEDDTFPDATECSEDARRRSGIAELHQLHVGDHPGTPPETREEERHEQVRRRKVPHHPHAADAVVGHEARDDQRGVGREHGCDNRCARNPPGQVAGGEKVLRDVPPGAMSKDQAHPEGEGDVRGDDEPVEDGHECSSGCE